MRAVYRDPLLPSAARAETAKVTELYSTREIAAAADVPVEPESRRRGGLPLADAPARAVTGGGTCRA